MTLIWHLIDFGLFESDLGLGFVCLHKAYLNGNMMDNLDALGFWISIDLCIRYHISIYPVKLSAFYSVMMMTVKKRLAAETKFSTQLFAI